MVATVVLGPEVAREATLETEEGELDHVVDLSVVRHCAVTVVVHAVAGVRLQTRKVRDVTQAVLLFVT